jgi:quercetin dioxygenase-like cupin family protein
MREKMSNKIVYVPARTGQAYWVMGDLFTYLVTGKESGGSYFTLEVNVGPGNGPPPHIHHREEEQFYILEGKLTLRVGDQTIRASPGDFIHIPRETVHSFKNGPTPARLLATFSPAGIEQFFQEAGDPVEDRSAPPPSVTQETIAHFMAVESRGWKEHHETLPPPATDETATTS